MKTILIFSVLLLLQSCASSSTSESAANELAKDSINAVATVVPTAEPDVSTGATNKHNPSMLTGTMIVPVENNVTVALPMGGVIASFTHLPGQFIKKGDVIAILENTEFIDLQQSYLEASSQAEYLETEYNRQRALSSEEATSQKRLQQSKAEYLAMKSRKDATSSRLQLLGVNPSELVSKGIKNRLTVRAPRAGYISEIMINQGKYVAAGDPLCVIIDKSRILLNLIAYEKDLLTLKTGKEIEFKVNGIGDEVFKAVISTIDQQVDPVNRSVKVYAKAISTHKDFRPGMYVIAQIK